MDDIEGGMNDEGYMESTMMSNYKYVQTDSIGTTSNGSMTDMSMYYIEALEQEFVRVCTMQYMYC